MIRVLLKKLVDDKNFASKEFEERITLNVVADKTGVSRSTLNRIANSPGYNCTTETINALCKYFDCQVGDLLEYVADK